MFCYAKKHYEMLDGNFSKLEKFSKSKKNTVLKSLIVLSKYLGVYREFKLRMTDYGVKFEQSNSVDAFLEFLIKNSEMHSEKLGKMIQTERI